MLIEIKSYTNHRDIFVQYTFNGILKNGFLNQNGIIKNFSQEIICSNNLQYFKDIKENIILTKKGNKITQFYNGSSK